MKLNLYQENDNGQCHRKRFDSIHKVIPFGRLGHIETRADGIAPKLMEIQDSQMKPSGMINYWQVRCKN
ncbi:hypothetical protein BLOT_012756 [Blomia tropicalis]|nr:hypothetical protein BLOT_012756 [Blomia tropicalis]